MKTKTRKKKTISKKKPLRPRLIKYIKILGLVAIPIVVVGLSFQLAKQLRPGNHSHPNKTINWKITTESSPASHSKVNIKDLKKELLRKGSNTSSSYLYQKAQRLQKKYQAKQVSIVQTSENHVHVHLYFYQPKMVVKADRLRLLASDGTVFGVASKDDQKNLPLLDGVFFERTKSVPFRLEAGSLITVQSEDVLLRKSLDILAIASKSLSFKEISYNNIDGFLLKNGNFFNEVYIGNDNFNEKIENLTVILNKIKKKNSYAEKIELDYSGKAFVKEKSLKK